MRAFETADIRLLERTLRGDAMLEMTPARTWFSGRATCLPYLATVIGQPGEWSMRATHANSQPAAVAHPARRAIGHRDPRYPRRRPCANFALHRPCGDPAIHSLSRPPPLTSAGADRGWFRAVSDLTKRYRRLMT
jgi:hypothetical protein